MSDYPFSEYPQMPHRIKPKSTDLQWLYNDMNQGAVKAEILNLEKV